MFPQQLMISMVSKERAAQLYQPPSKTKDGDKYKVEGC